MYGATRVIEEAKQKDLQKKKPVLFSCGTNPSLTDIFFTIFCSSAVIKVVISPFFQLANLYASLIRLAHH